MKKTYIAPEGTVIMLMAEEKLAALDGHPDSGLMTAAGDDTLIGSTVVGDDRPF